ncbi:MAG: hypothetical protein EAY75_08680 [Bacteroidetes bacterium]|nr:MAG: hypothetical protein EAY75_08680 [Bacteroidota bacterium]
MKVPRYLRVATVCAALLGSVITFEIEYVAQMEGGRTDNTCVNAAWEMKKNAMVAVIEFMARWI